MIKTVWTGFKGSACGQIVESMGRLGKYCCLTDRSWFCLRMEGHFYYQGQHTTSTCPCFLPVWGRWNACLWECAQVWYYGTIVSWPFGHYFISKKLGPEPGGRLWFRSFKLPTIIQKPIKSHARPDLGSWCGSLCNGWGSETRVHPARPSQTLTVAEACIPWADRAFLGRH